MALPRTMRAVVCHGKEDYRVQEVPVPEPEAGEVLLRVEAVGICASDAKCFAGAPLFWGDAQREAYCQAPVIAGHEFVGEVVALGAGGGDGWGAAGEAVGTGAAGGDGPAAPMTAAAAAATDHAVGPAGSAGLRVGDRVVSEQIVPCGACRYCLRGQYWMCMRHDIYGFRRRTPGAMAEYVRLPRGARNYVLPPGMSLEAGALVEPLGCSIHAVDRAGIRMGDVVVVAGCGPLGLGMVAAARLRGPGLLVAVDAREGRLAVARDCGADLTLDLSRVDAVAEVLALTEGYGCDVYIEASGAPAAVEQGLRMVRKLGTFVEFSVMREPCTVDWTIIGDTKELDVRGSHLSPYTYPVAIDMLRRGQVPVARIVTHTLPLEAFNQGMDLVLKGDRSIKVQLRP